VEDTALQSIRAQGAKEALDHVQPRSRRGREVDVKARMVGQPLLDVLMLVRGVVVTDQMELLTRGVCRSMRRRNFSHSVLR
jgi:hypothetical protein